MATAQLSDACDALVRRSVRLNLAIIGLGAGSELQKPLALAVIGGLALSTPITLDVVPTLLVAIRGRDYRIASAS